MRSKSWLSHACSAKAPRKAQACMTLTCRTLFLELPTRKIPTVCKPSYGESRQHTRVKQSGRQKHPKHMAVVSIAAHQTSQCAGSSCRLPVAPGGRWGSGSAFCRGAFPSCLPSEPAGRAAGPPAVGIGCRLGQWWSLPTFHPREITYMFYTFFLLFIWV